MCTHYVAYYNTLPRIEKVGLSSSQLPPSLPRPCPPARRKREAQVFLSPLALLEDYGPFPLSHLRDSVLVIFLAYAVGCARPHTQCPARIMNGVACVCLRY